MPTFSSFYHKFIDLYFINLWIFSKSFKMRVVKYIWNILSKFESHTAMGTRFHRSTKDLIWDFENCCKISSFFFSQKAHVIILFIILFYSCDDFILFATWQIARRQSALSNDNQMADCHLIQDYLDQICLSNLNK